MLSGFVLALLSACVSVLHGLRVGFCDLWDGISVFALGPGVGSVLGGAFGAFAGLFVGTVSRPRRRVALAVVLALCGPLAGIGVSLWRFWSSPMVFAFDPFFGYFAGPLYDTVIEPLERLESYRLGSLFSLLAGAALALHLDRGATGLTLRSRGRPGVVLAGLLAAAGSFLVTANGPKLGHYSTTDSIREVLERSLTTDRCEVLYPPSVVEREARLLGRECDAHVKDLEAWFETRHPERITVFVFESEAQKGRLMGAASTYIAKPWRNEIYIQWARYPHPVMGHELAHVVAGSFGRGPFRVSGPLGGLVPDPGRIEGVATAATPSDDPELTLAEWSRAMLDLGLLPPLRDVFRLGFLGENSSKAYTVAGAFIAFLRDRHGAGAVRRWYAGESLESITGGKGLEALDAEFRAALAGAPMAPEVLEAARARFDRPAIFRRKCPHVVDRLLGEANGRLGQGDVRGASERFDRVLGLDRGNFSARMGLSGCSARAGDTSQAERRYAEIAADASLHKLLRLSAEEARADLELATGRAADASARYRTIRGSISDEDRLRTLDVKAEPRTAEADAAIAALLVGDPKLGRDFGDAAARLGEWARTEPDNGLPEYLLGRNFYNGGRYEESARRLDRALARKLALPRVEVEALRLRLVVACALDDRTRAREVLGRYLGHSELAPGARVGASQLARRCGI